MNKTILCALLFAAGCSKSTPPTPPSPAGPTNPVQPSTPPTPPSAPAAAADDDAKLDKLTLADVEKRRKEPNFYVFDNNSKERFDQGHVPGAKWVDPEKITAADLPTDKTATLLFYCGGPGCMSSHEGAQAALKLGYTKVYIMPDGISGWEKAKLPTEPSKA